VRVAPGIAGATALLGFGVAAALTASYSAATSFDPGLAVEIVVGHPSGSCPMSRTDGARTGRSSEPLPDRPGLLWRSSSRGTLSADSVAVDRRGSVVVASAKSPDIIQFAADGHQEWSAKTGNQPPLAGPVILADQTRVVLTGAGAVFGFYPDGTRRFVTELGSLGRITGAAPLPLDDGGIALAAGTAVFVLSADGTMHGRSEIGARASGPLVQTAHGIAVTTETGNVHLANPPASARRVGTFGGSPGPGAAASDGNTLLAVVDHNRLLAFDVRTGVSRRLDDAQSTMLDGPVAIDPAKIALITTFSGLLMSIAPDGASVRRTALETRAFAPFNDAGAIDLAAMAESPPVVIDAAGRVGFARVGGRIGIVSPQGAVSAVDKIGCEVPVALAPAGNGRMVVTCRDGTILMIGQRATP
jgi:outer membrane protein assembly factor BamB